MGDPFGQLFFPSIRSPLPDPCQTPLDPPPTPSWPFVDFFFLAFVVLGGSDQRRAMGRMVKPAVLPLILLVAAM